MLTSELLGNTADLEAGVTTSRFSVWEIGFMIKELFAFL